MQDVQAQGPFAISADGQWLLFFSPRGGNFDIYRVPLNDEGREAMKIRSGATELSPALHAQLAGQTGAATGVAAGAQSSAPAAAPGNAQVVATAPAPSAPAEADQSSPSAAPYFLLAAGALVAMWLAVEGLRWGRRRARRRSTG
jgi:hypothetical protein